MKYNEELGMLEFDDKGVVVKVPIELALTENDIETIIVGGFEGGIDYWAGFSKADNKDTFSNKPKSEPVSTWATKVLIEGGTIYLYDNEEWNGESEKKLLPLDLKRLVNGVRLNHLNREWDNDIENGDVVTYDCIIQYALFGELVYG